jgi:hypothetical protein
MPTHIEDTVAAITEMHAQHRREASAYQRIIDKLTALLGRSAFVGVITNRRRSEQLEPREQPVPRFAFRDSRPTSAARFVGQAFRPAAHEGIAMRAARPRNRTRIIGVQTRSDERQTLSVPYYPNYLVM